MRVLGTGNSAMVIKGPQKSSAGWRVDREIRPRLLTAGGVVEIALKDSVYDRHTSAVYAQDSSLSVADDTSYGDILYSSEDPDVATVDVEGNVTVLQTGKLVRVRVTCQGLTVQKVWVSSIQESATVDIFKRFADESLGRAAETAVDSLAAEMTGKTTSLFTSLDGSSLARVDNFWAADYVSQLTCFSPWNDYPLHGQKGGTLITPRHLALAWHFPTPNGSSFKFVEADGTVHTRTQIGTSYGVTPSAARDRLVVTLNEDLPAGISPVKVLPSDYRDYLPRYSSEAIGYVNPIPAIILNQRKQARVTEINFLSTDHSIGHRKPTVANRLALWGSLVGGDSGSPGFLIANGELVLAFTHGSSTGGPAWYAGSLLESLIAGADANAGISTGYQAAAADFSAYAMH